MTRPPRRLLTDAEKDALLDRQAVLIDALMARIAALEAALAKVSIGVQTGPLFGPYRRRIGTPLVRVDLDGATIRDERCS